MSKRVHYHPNLIYSEGTQVVTVKEIIGPNGRTSHPRGSVGVIVRAPRDLDHSYRVRFPDGVEEALKPNELTLLASFKEGEIGDEQITAGRSDLFQRVIFKCIIGSRAFGLDDDQSDTDYRGVYLPPLNCNGRCMACPNNWTAMKHRKPIGSCKSFWYWR